MAPSSGTLSSQGETVSSVLMDFFGFTSMSDDLPADYHTIRTVPDTSSQESQSDYDDYYDWPFPPNNSTDFFAGFYCVKEETVQGVSLTRAGTKVLTSSLTTVFLPVVYILVFIVGLPTNTMAVWVFLFRTKKKHPASILLANLALADLLFIIWLPLKITYHFNGNHWTFGEPLCKVLVGFFYGNMYCSSIFIACISLQRYWAVAHPLSHRLDNRVVVCVSVCVWLVVCLLTIPLYLYDQTVEVTNLNITTCHDAVRPTQIHIPIGCFWTMGIVGYVVPCLVCTVSYALTFRSIRRSMTVSSANDVKKKATILTITVLVMFLVCFTPSNVMLMVYYSLMSRWLHNHVFGIYVATLCISSINSSMDPFVYYFISPEFREHVKNTLRCRSERTVRRMKVNFSLVKVSTETSSPSTDSTTQ
ncbi:proteinase-activated receptor 2-like [Salminus brasiliensis]|uniref:proteinase-activated receptor 2-like n=1 Tax=Salminus brasiliensis TaxID=930266 RepID=UPI003B82C82C